MPTVKREAIRRTAVDVHALSLTWTDWMGLNRAKIKAECQRPLVVHPRVSRVEVERFPSGDGERPGRRVDRSGSRELSPSVSGGQETRSVTSIGEAAHAAVSLSWSSMHCRALTTCSSS